MSQSQIAILVDGDGISHKIMGHIIEEVSSSGNIVENRVCGTEKHLNGWRKEKKNYLFKLVQAPKGENSTDRLVLREALDITVYSPKIDIFYIVANDKHFLEYYDILKKMKKQIFFIGTKGAAKSLKKSPSFILIESGKKPSLRFNKMKQVPESSKIKSTHEFLQLLKKAFESFNHEWIDLSELGKILIGIAPTYKDDYGAKLSKLLKRVPDFVEMNGNMVRVKNPT